MLAHRPFGDVFNNGDRTHNVSILREGSDPGGLPHPSERRLKIGWKNEQIVVEPIGQNLSMSVQSIAIVVFETARRYFRECIEQGQSLHIRRFTAGMSLEPAIPAANDQIRVGNKDSVRSI